MKTDIILAIILIAYNWFILFFPESLGGAERLKECDFYHFNALLHAVLVGVFLAKRKYVSYCVAFSVFMLSLGAQCSSSHYIIPCREAKWEAISGEHAKTKEGIADEK